MNRHRLVRWQIVLLAILLLVLLWRMVVGPPEPDGLVVLTHLHAHDLEQRAFTLEEPARVAVEAVGSFADDGRGLAAYAWIFAREGRRLAWQQQAASAERLRGTLARTRDTLALPAGTYDVYFAAYAPGAASAASTDDDDDDGRRTRWAQDADGWRFVLRPLDADAEARAEDHHAHRHKMKVATFEGNTWHAAPLYDGQHAEYLFEAHQPARLALYGVGEIGEAAQDYAWIEDAVTGARVWTMDRGNTEPAGGLDRNRRFEGEVRLDPGVYRLAAATDRQHAYGDWEGPPPFDPLAWGLQATFLDPNAVAPFDPWASREPLIAFTRIGRRADERQRFEVTRPLNVALYALGEITTPDEDDVFDYAELMRQGPAGEERFWTMNWQNTSPAGGHKKNRVAVAFLHLEPGRYTLRYRTDGSHDFSDWNEPPPAHGERWGAALFPMEEDLDPSAVRLLASAPALAEPREAPAAPAPEAPAAPEPPVIAALPGAEVVGAGTELVRWHGLGGRMHKTYGPFYLEAPTRLHVTALGEITRSGQYDYGWIEDAATGESVWEMTYDNTEPAGGHSRNRRFDGVFELPAGAYVAHFKTDARHHAGDFDDAPPRNPNTWGMAIAKMEE